MREHEDGFRHERVIAAGDAETVKRESARRTRRSFLVGGAAAAAGVGAGYWINNSRPVGRLQQGLRKTLNADAAINRAVWDERGLAPTYPLRRARPLRLNGVIGLEKALVIESWRLQLAGVADAASSPLYVKDITAWEYNYADAATGQPPPDLKSAPPDRKIAPRQGPVSALNPSGAVDTPAATALAALVEQMQKQRSPKRYQGDEEAGPSSSSLDIGTPGLLLTMGDLMHLPRVEFVTQFKCIEGWSNITQWAGVRLRDLIEAYPPQKNNGREPRYVYMETPDGNFYGGYDMSAARHPQSLLVTEMGGSPLAQEHGAPLRLHMPIKYGYKQLKRIGLIAYMDTKPDDYWTRLGYDWFAGL